MRRATPVLFDALRSVTRRIVLYSADLPNSFATLSAHGVAFLNVKDDNDEVFFVDDLAHQCGHIMFNALTQEKPRFLARTADTPLRDFCRDREDRARCTRRFTGCSRSARSCGSCRPAWRIESCRIGSGTRRSAASRST